MRRLAVPFTLSFLTFALGVLSVHLGNRIASLPIHVKADIAGTSEASSKRQPSRQEWEAYFGTPLIWEFLSNDEYGRLAVVRSDADSLNGKVKAKLRFACPSQRGSIQILVGDMEQTGFDLGGYSLKSNLPVLKRNKVEVTAISEGRKLSFRTKAVGRIGYENLKPTVVFFELIERHGLERMIAKGGTEVTFTIHDLIENDRRIIVTFPEIEVSSEMVKDLNGCRAARKR
jgi:hypothetical protein